MKIFAASLVQETNTFSPLPTTLDDFTLVRRADILHGKKTFDDIEPFSHWARRAREKGCEFIFGGCFFAQPSGTVALNVYESMRNELLAELAGADGVDVVLLYLHGAMVADGIDDCEGDLIRRVRSCVGEKTVIAVEIDLHAHLTDQMLAYSDLVISFKEYPHVDIVERGAELFDHAVNAARRVIKPTMASFECKMMGMYPTSAPIMRKFVSSLSDAETLNNVLSVSFVHGFPFGDVEDAGAKILVITNDDQSGANALAHTLGSEAYSLRHKIGFSSLDMADALNLALKNCKANLNGPVVVADQSDNVGAGAPGDATYALEWLLNKGVANVALGILYDPEVVAKAKLAGAGQTISVDLGGKMGNFSGNTLKLVAGIRSIQTNYNHLWPQRDGASVKYPAGDVVALRCEGIDIIVSSKRIQCFSPSIFTDLGVDFAGKDLLVVKSTQHFQGAFSAIASRIIYMAAPGAVSPDILKIPYKKMPTHDKYPWNDGKKTKKSFFAGIPVLCAAVIAAPNAVAEETANSDFLLEEIVVTAQKRSQSLQDTAMSVTALGAREIERRNIVSMEDYLSTIPGVNVAAEGVGVNRITIRGVRASGSEDSTVGVFFGEVPLNTVINGSAVDLKMVDLERVEVLRGPQGTLFGSGSMSGAVRTIPQSPNLERVEGSLEAGYSSTAESGGANYEAVGVLNVPLIQDELAVRVVAYKFDNSGYIDNVAGSDPDSIAFAETFGASVRNEDGIGGSDYTGGRVSMLWKPTEALEVTLTQAWQDLAQDEGFQSVNLTLDDYQSKPVQFGDTNGGDQFRDDDIQITNLVINYDFGWGSLLSSTSKTSGGGDRGLDLASGALNLALVQITDEGRDLLAQEVRFISSWDSPFQLIAGVYYEDVEQTIRSDATWYGDPATIGLTPFGSALGTDPNDVFQENSLFSNDQTAVFSELSYQLNEQFEITFGGRWFDYERRERVLQTGALGDVDTDQFASEKDTSLKAHVSYTPTDDLLIYAQWAQGFRIGAPVTPAPAAACDRFGADGSPGADGRLDGTNISIDNDTVESDELDNYEIGTKFSLLSGRLQTRAAIYRIDWTGIPVSLRATPDCGFSVLVNAGEARIEGVELELSYYLTENWRLDFGISSLEAELTTAGSLGPKGTRLPGTAELNASAGIEYTFDLSGRPAFARANYAYVGEYQDDIRARFTEAGGYDKLDARAGISLETIDVSMYVTNLLNENALTSVVGDPTLAFQMRPRTIGIDIEYQF